MSDLDQIFDDLRRRYEAARALDTRREQARPDRSVLDRVREFGTPETSEEAFNREEAATTPQVGPALRAIWDGRIADRERREAEARDFHDIDRMMAAPHNQPEAVRRRDRSLPRTEEGRVDPINDESVGGALDQGRSTPAMDAYRAAHPGAGDEEVRDWLDFLAYQERDAGVHGSLSATDAREANARYPNVYSGGEWKQDRDRIIQRNKSEFAGTPAWQAEETRLQEAKNRRATAEKVTRQTGDILRAAGQAASDAAVVRGNELRPRRLSRDEDTVRRIQDHDPTVPSGDVELYEYVAPAGTSDEDRRRRALERLAQGNTDA